MEDMKNLLNDILDKDETVIKVFKPNRLKKFWSMYLSSFIVWLWVVLVAGFVFGEIFGTTTTLSDGSEVTYLYVTAFIIAVLASIVICTIVIYIFFRLSYSKTYYAYTNKRIVIRRGIIGVDYKSLDKDTIGAVTVNVSVLDKIMHKNTGTIVFGSMSSPIVSNGMMFRFANITDPYSVYKEIKNNIDDSKNKANSSNESSEAPQEENNSEE